MLFYLQVDCLHEQRNTATASLQLWHGRLWHENRYSKFGKGCSRMKLIDEGNEPCDVCNTEKANRLPISRQVATRAKKIF